MPRRADAVLHKCLSARPTSGGCAASFSFCSAVIDPYAWLSSHKSSLAVGSCSAAAIGSSISSSAPRSMNAWMTGLMACSRLIRSPSFSKSSARIDVERSIASMMS